MPHSTVPSFDTLASFTSEDFETSSIVVAQAAQKHQSSVTNIATRRESMATIVPSGSDFSFVEQPLPTLPSPVDASLEVKPLRKEKSTPNLGRRSGSPGSEGTAVPYRPSPKPQGELSRTSREGAHYYEEQSAYKSHPSTARERVTRDAPVVAELRTNVIINDEYTLTTDLSYHLSTRYQRPESSIAVTIQHSACLCLGGSFQPAYLLTITTLPSLIQPSTNKRNTALIQSFMSDTLAVPADRGIIRFLPIQEENIATNSRTILDEIERLKRLLVEEKKISGKGNRRSLILRRARSNETIRRKTSTKTIATSNPSAQSPKASDPPPLPLSPVTGRGPSSPSHPADPEPFDSSGVLINGQGAVVNNVNHISQPSVSPVDSKMGSPKYRTASRQQGVDRKASGKKGAKQLPLLPSDMPHLPPPPPVPTDDERTEKTRKLGKRRSLISILRGK